MPYYDVTFTFGVYAEDPEAAARDAYEAMRDPAAMPPIAEVIPRIDGPGAAPGEPTDVDLNEIEDL
ncbi:MAG: hypothetical protein DWQ46_18225 [Planctomycetota bacterium]|nr:MAG: hypothetical protein DWQ46_18225 [Planctomycetota bacterium]